MSSKDIIVIGASAGGIEPLRRLVVGLPKYLPATLFVVVHIPATYPSSLAEILNKIGNIPASQAQDGEAIQQGRVYVAPPDHHLLLAEDGMHLSRGPAENRFRPAVDPLFRSAAEAYRERVVGVVLSGALYDGTSGLLSIKRHGGISIVQTPEESRFAGMPQSAISGDHPDYILPVSEIVTTLIRLAQEPSDQRLHKHSEGINAGR